MFVAIEIAPSFARRMAVSRWSDTPVGEDNRLRQEGIYVQERRIKNTSPTGELRFARANDSARVSNALDTSGRSAGARKYRSNVKFHVAPGRRFIHSYRHRGFCTSIGLHERAKDNGFLATNQPRMHFPLTRDSV